MAEIAFDGVYRDEPTEEWGLDGWTNRNIFHVLLTTERSGTVVDLNIEQCYRLAVTLLNHIKEVADATEKDIT